MYVGEIFFYWFSSLNYSCFTEFINFYLFADQKYTYKAYGKMQVNLYLLMKMYVFIYVIS